jgi:GWxTD domain-containing protein
LPWRVGGKVGFTVDAAAFPDSAGTTLDIYVRIPPATLAGLARDDDGNARVSVRAQLKGAFGGGPTREQQQEFAIEPVDSVGGFGKVVALRFSARPGRHRLQVRVEDALSRKRGLAYVGRTVRESGRVEGEVSVAGPESGRQLSDVEFVWTARSGGPRSTFERGGRTVLPNPERLYGLYAGSLQAAFTARSPEVRPWRWTARVMDAEDRMVAERESTAVAARRLQGALAVDLATEPAGGYDLEIRAWQEGDSVPLVRRAPFSVAWQAGSWTRTARDIEDEVHFLLSADEEEKFILLSAGEQERYLDEFWKRRDPSPGTGTNEARNTFLRRVTRANRLYSRPAFGKGMFSDMGRVYIRYGEPSEIVNEVIPTGDQSLDLVISQLSRSESRAIGDISMKGPGGDQRAFELWIYEGPIGLPPDADPEAAGRQRRRRLVFLFVDERGTGDYRLRYSTE